MERGRGAIKADIGDEFAALGNLIKAREIGALMQKAALDEGGDKIGPGAEIAVHGWPRIRSGEVYGQGPGNATAGT